MKTFKITFKPKLKPSNSIKYVDMIEADFDGYEGLLIKPSGEFTVTDCQDDMTEERMLSIVPYIFPSLNITSIKLIEVKNVGGLYVE